MTVVTRIFVLLVIMNLLTLFAIISTEANAALHNPHRN